jgi:hypothetical protein
MVRSPKTIILAGARNSFRHAAVAVGTIFL